MTAAKTDVCTFVKNPFPHPPFKPKPFSTTTRKQLFQKYTPIHCINNVPTQILQSQALNLKIPFFHLAI